MPIPPKLVAVAVTLPRLAPAIALGEPSQATVAVTLPRLTVAVVASRPDKAAEIHITLPRLVPAIVAGHPNVLAVHVRLPRVSMGVHLGGRPNLTSLTGQVGSNGAAILHFHGPPYRALEWSIAEGFGILDNKVDYTDERGNATARYRPNGYTGVVILQVAYGS